MPDKISPQEQSTEADVHTATTISDTAVSVDDTQENAEEQTTSANTTTQTLARQNYRRRTRFSTAMKVLLIVLSVALIVSGLAFITYRTSTGYRASLHRVATVDAQSTQNVVNTAQANTEGTIQALSTIQASIDATATAVISDSTTATAVVNNAQATATVLGNLYQQSTRGEAVLNDPLNDNTSAGKWDERKLSPGTSCAFTGGAYVVSEAQQGNLLPCFAQGTNFDNFVYQVHVTFHTGNQGQAGIIFRADSNKQAYYFFRISVDGSYALDLYSSDGSANTLINGISHTIITGERQTNQLIVIATQESIYLFANNQYITGVNDHMLTAGKIGVAVVDKNTPVVVSFDGAQVWQLQNASPSPSPSPSPVP